MTLQELMDACEQVRESRGFDGSASGRFGHLNCEVSELGFELLSVDYFGVVKSKTKIAQEFGDAMFTILTLGAALQREFGIDPLKATLEKLEDTKRRYPEVRRRVPFTVFGEEVDIDADDFVSEEFRCGCKLCDCLNTTQNGEPCPYCESGAHQG